ncbi:MAG: sulfatase-like hydrolase/transferase [Burkholderiaceae bacterium]
MTSIATKTRYRHVLILCSDEHDPRHSGFGGSPVARTPNLDRLAARATVFTRAYTPSPICVPARASLATGHWVHRHRCWDNAIAYSGATPSWGHALQRAGIGVESIGKLHYRDAEADTGFDRQAEAAHIVDGIGQVWGCVRDPLPDKGEGAGLFRRMGAGESDYNRFDKRVAEGAVRWLQTRAEDPGGAPAALFVGLVAPHFPLVVPQPYLDLYPDDSLPWPKLRPETGYVRHPWVQRQAEFNELDLQLGTDERRRLAIRSYLGLVSFLDERIGQVLDAIDALGIADETLVIHISDHGDNLGARGMWNKSLLYRESTQVPMMIAGPGVPQRSCATNTSLVDIYPTVLHALGVPHDDSTRPGRSLMELAGQPDQARIVLSEYHAIGSPTGAFMVADERFKLHHYVGYEPELFDLLEDPEETRSIHDQPRHRERLDSLQASLRAIVDPEATDRLAKDDQNAFIERFGGREKALTMTRFGATPVPQDTGGGAR